MDTRTGCPRSSLPSKVLTAMSASSREVYSKILLGIRFLIFKNINNFPLTLDQARRDQYQRMTPCQLHDQNPSSPIPHSQQLLIALRHGAANLPACVARNPINSEPNSCWAFAWWGSVTGFVVRPSAPAFFSEFYDDAKAE